MARLSTSKTLVSGGVVRPKAPILRLSWSPRIQIVRTSRRYSDPIRSRRHLRSHIVSERSLHSNVVLVAGGTGVLGSLIAEELDRRGARLVIGGRNPDRLNSVTAKLSDAVSCDLDFLDVASVERAIALTIERFGRLDGLVNAAGVVAFGPLEELNGETLRDLLTVDLVGPLDLIRAALPHLDAGFVVNLPGVVAEQPVGNMAAYSAAKAGLCAASVALNRELRRRRITILDARPPHTETGLAGRAISGTAPSFPEGLPPARVAHRIVEGIVAGERQLPAEAFQS